MSEHSHQYHCKIEEDLEDEQSSLVVQPEATDLEVVEKLRFFLATAPSSFTNETAPLDPLQQHQQSYISSTQYEPEKHQSELDGIHRFRLPNGEHISCIRWQSLYHITGTDIIRTLVFRFHAFGRKICNMKKFEEGVFSDLRNLKAGTDATLETPKSALLDLLFKYNCIRTQKKQKVFYWYSVPHDKLFIDALERDAKREKAGLKATSIAVAAPASSFQYDSSRPLAEQLPAFNATISAASNFTLSSSSSSKTSAEPANPATSLDEVAYIAVPEGAMSALAREIRADGVSGQESFNLESYHQIADLGEFQLGPPFHSTYEPVNSLHQQPLTNQESSDICMGLSSLSDTEPMHVLGPPAPAHPRFICPVLPCGLLFSNLDPLLQHLQHHHSTPSNSSESSTQAGHNGVDRGTQLPENAQLEYAQLSNVILGMGSHPRQDTDPTLVTPTLYRRKTPFSFTASTSEQNQIAWPFDELHEPCATEHTL